MWLMQEAMRALPDDLRKHAEIIDESPPPENRPQSGIWETPPVPGFNIAKYTKRTGEGSSGDALEDGVEVEDDEADADATRSDEDENKPIPRNKRNR